MRPGNALRARTRTGSPECAVAWEGGEPRPGRRRSGLTHVTARTTAATDRGRAHASPPWSLVGPSSSRLRTEAGTYGTSHTRSDARWTGMPSASRADAWMLRTTGLPCRLPTRTASSTFALRCTAWRHPCRDIERTGRGPSARVRACPPSVRTGRAPDRHRPRSEAPQARPACRGSGGRLPRVGLAPTRRRGPSSSTTLRPHRANHSRGAGAGRRRPCGCGARRAHQHR